MPNNSRDRVTPTRSGRESGNDRNYSVKSEGKRSNIIGKVLGVNGMYEKRPYA